MHRSGRPWYLERTEEGHDGSTQRARRILYTINAEVLNASQWLNVGIWRELKKATTEARKGREEYSTQLTQRLLLPTELHKSLGEVMNFVNFSLW